MYGGWGVHVSARVDTGPVARWNLLTDYLQQRASSVTLSWTELDGIVDGLPPSAARHRAWWSGDRPQVRAWQRAGFAWTDLHPGERVTFVPMPAAAVESRKQCWDEPVMTMSAASGVPARPAPDVILLACSKSKASRPAPARDLYTSALFVKGRAYAERVGVPWFILSAEHGLVHPATLLAPYERHLRAQSTAYRRAWGARVVADLQATAGPLVGRVIEVHAGAAYLGAIRGQVRAAGAVATEPLDGLRLGERLQWYVSAASEVGSVGLRVATDEPLGFVQLIAALTDRSSAVSPSQFLARGSAGLQVPGLYTWWVDAEGARMLAAGLGLPLRAGLIYAGLAGATRWPSGQRSSSTLWSRIAQMHLGASHGRSTLRRTVGAILAGAQEATAIDEARLSRWLEAHAQVIAVPSPNPDTLGRVEAQVLGVLDPPLNLRGMPTSELRAAVRRLRSAITR